MLVVETGATTSDKQSTAPGRGACTVRSRLRFLPCPSLRKPNVENDAPSATLRKKSNSVASALLMFEMVWRGWVFARASLR